jgi:hypothetical protein
MVLYISLFSKFYETIILNENKLLKPLLYLVFLFVTKNENNYRKLLYII